MFDFPQLQTAVEVHGVRTLEAFLAKQRDFIAHNRRGRPDLPWTDPKESDQRLAARVSGGKWVVDCPCGNAPATHPDWRVAACFMCGAIYREVVFPEQIREIEALLMKRGRRHRHWVPTETVADVARDNVLHGIL